MKRLFCAIVLPLLLCLTSAEAVRGDRNEPVKISANSLEVDEIQQTALYKGNVFLQQGTLKMTGDRLLLTVLPNGYKTLDLRGTPAFFEQVKEPENRQKAKEKVQGSAGTIFFSEKTGIVTMRTSAHLVQFENGKKVNETFGDEVLYDSYQSQTVIEGNSKPASAVLKRKKIRGKN